MTSASKDTIRYWRQRAVELREKAAGAVSQKAKDEFLAVAQQYEAMAEVAEWSGKTKT